MEKLDKVVDLLKKYNQEHLIKGIEKLNSEEQEKLLDQILSIDFDLMKSLYEKTKTKPDLGGGKVEPIEHTDKDKLTAEEMKYYYDKGAEVIRKGEYAVVTMAGGQGTRLGYTAPKGTFPIIENISLFEGLATTIKEAMAEFNSIIPWYLMTSRENNDATVKFFEEHNYFGLDKENVVFFKQGELPMCGTDGKILIDENGNIKLAADGHGGVFESMYRNGVIDDMKKRGIKWMFISGVDNVLAKTVDAVLTGLAIDKNVLAAGKSVVKSNPKERVGVFCKKNGRPYVIEYTEISDEMAEMLDENAELLYGESHILCNLFNIKEIEEVCKNKLPYHSAFKKAKYIDENGELVVPTEPNAYKFEAFIFDAFERLSDMVILRVKREEEFAPLKNADGVDSPDTARKLYLNYLNSKKNK